MSTGRCLCRTTSLPARMLCTTRSTVPQGHAWYHPPCCRFRGGSGAARRTAIRQPLSGSSGSALHWYLALRVPGQLSRTCPSPAHALASLLSCAMSRPFKLQCVASLGDGCCRGPIRAGLTVRQYPNWPTPRPPWVHGRSVVALLSRDSDPADRLFPW
jgi:hypothetical protein